jgi:hypothetical protein
LHELVVLLSRKTRSALTRPSRISASMPSRIALAFAAVLTLQSALNLRAETKQTWGPVEKGVRAGLTIDRLTYAVGEDVPLHIALENISATHLIYGEPFRPRLAFGKDVASIRVTVQDEDGPLTPSESFGIEVTSGPAVCPAPYPPGNPMQIEKSLRRVGQLPSNPGTYKITVTWDSYTTGSPTCKVGFDPSAIPEKPYVSVTSNPISIEIKGGSPLLGKGSDVPEYTAWKKKFSLTDTSFGEKTALLDNVTLLEWLRLNLTKGLSYNQVRAQMADDGSLAGWRYATAAELQTFFKDFIGSSDTSSDPSIEAKLQRLMGGPLNTASNPKTGWHRTWSLGLVGDLSDLGRERRGYIADDRDTGALITPEIWGYTADGVSDQGAPGGSYLVRHR